MIPHAGIDAVRRAQICHNCQLVFQNRGVIVKNIAGQNYNIGIQAIHLFHNFTNSAQRCCSIDMRVGQLDNPQVFINKLMFNGDVVNIRYLNPLINGIYTQQCAKHQHNHVGMTKNTDVFGVERPAVNTGQSGRAVYSLPNDVAQHQQTKNNKDKTKQSI